MKLTKMDLDNKMSTAEMKQIKAGSVTSSSNGNTCTSKSGRDVDNNGVVSDTGF